MSDEQPSVEVPPKATDQIVKGQIRLVLAFASGSLLSHYALPAGLINDQFIDVVAGVVLASVASAWSWVRARLNHSRFFAIASDPRVPDEVAKVAEK